MAGRIAYTGNIVRDGLVLLLDAAKKDSYPGSGTAWNDISGNGNNGTLINGPTFNSSNNGSIVFDGVDDYATGLLSTLADWTISLWYQSADITSQLVFYPMSTTNGANGIGFGGTFTSDTNNRWYFFDGTSVLSNANTAILVNIWYNLTVTKTSTTYNLYTNGVLSLNTSGINLTSTQYTLGRRGNGQFPVKGSIGNASIYNRALTAAEVSQNYNALKGRYGL